VERALSRDLRAAVAATAAAILLSGALAANAADASAATPVGTTIASRDLAVAGESGKKPAIDGSQVNVLVFFRADKEYSRLGLKELVPCVARTAGKPVRWVTVTSPSQPADASAAAVREAGLAVPVLVDEGDAYYVELGISQLPAVAVFEKGRKLTSFQTFTKLNFCEHVFTLVRQALGELTEAEAKAEFDPTPIPIRGEASVAMRHVKKAQLLLRGGDAAKAAAAAREAVAADEKLAAAHSVLGASLAASGDCGAAVASFEGALALDPADARALQGKANCAGGRK